MTFDRNPKFGQDQAFVEGAYRTADFLWNAAEGDVSQFPKSYLENLRHEFSNGKISMLELIDRVDLGPDASYDEYCEMIDSLIFTDPAIWPVPDDVVEVPFDSLEYEIEPEFDFSEIYDFAQEFENAAAQPTTDGPDPMSEKIEQFFKKVIASVYREGVTAVTDAAGNPPNKANSYLMSPDGKVFSGMFYDSPPGEKALKFPFSITEGSDGQWQIKY